MCRFHTLPDQYGMYVHVFTCTYLQIPTVGMCRYSTLLDRIIQGFFCAGFCVVSWSSARLNCGRRMAVAWPSHGRCMAITSPQRIAAASPLHDHRIAILSPQRIGAASRRCTKCRRLVDFIRITQDSHLPVVPLPTRCTRKKWSLSKFSRGLWPSGQSDDEDTCRSHGRKVVTR